MDEDGTTVAPTNEADTSAVTDINSEEGGVSASDVADVLHLTTPTEATPTEEAPEEPIADEPVETPVTPGVPAVEETPPVPTAPEMPAEMPSFSLEIEDVNGNKYTISPDDNLEDVLAEFEPKNNGQVIQLMRDLDKLSTDKMNWQSDQEKAATDAEYAQTVTNIQSGWDKEITNLQGQKRIPVGADGKPNQERVNSVFKFMQEENAKRIESGVPPIQSFEDALDKMELRESRETAKQADKEAREEAKRRGSLVGGSSAPASSGAAVYKAGSAHNATDAARLMGLL